MAPTDWTHVRSQSISSDRPSTAGFGAILSPPISVSPDPAFIAASAASQIVTNDHDSQSDNWLDQHGIEPSGETAFVAPPSLKLVNRFLDQLLFNFLAVSKSTSLASLRPAVSEILRPKLARAAISGADQELQEYLGGGDDEEVMAYHDGLEANEEWDLELIWKRTRLRCMVYSSLGDMEEEDEDFYTEQEHLDFSPRRNGLFSDISGVVSPAVAIFLTSILEFVGEQVLVAAGQAAYQRLRTKAEKEANNNSNAPSEIAERVVVEELDMERVALDRTLGRLWRGWKKRIRSPNNSISLGRQFSRESLRSQPQASRATSLAPEDRIEEVERRPSLAAVLAEFEFAAAIPLPMSKDDIREIEIPGLASQRDGSEVETSSIEEDIPQSRPKSMLIFTHGAQYHPTPKSTPSQASPLPKSRKRSNSLPTPIAIPYTPSKRQRQLPNEDIDEVGSVGAKGQISDDNITNETDNDLTSQTETSSSQSETGIIGGVLAFGALATAGIVAAVNGEAPQTEYDARSEIDSDEEFIEEPEVVQIMTSSRISIGGQISSEDLSRVSSVQLSRASSIRSHGGHSVRVIEVSSIKSPSLSRNHSVDALFRTNSLHSPIVDPLDSRGPSPISRSSNSSPLVRNMPEEPIPEVEEKDAYDIDSEEVMTAVPAELAAAMQGVDVEPSPTSQNFSSAENNRQNTPQPFILNAAPLPRHRKHNARSMGIEQQTSQPNGRVVAGARSPDTDNGAPPLTPLREMMEIAQSTSDEASSVTASYDSPSGSVSTTPRQRTARNINTNVSRGSPARSTRDETLRKVPEYTKSQRAVHTSDSRSPSTSQREAMKRNSDEASISASSKKQSFEQLIRSDQTIQYTLTPENMRNIESLDSPRNPGSIHTTHTFPRPGTGRSRSSSINKFMGLRSNPPDVSKQATRHAENLNTGSRLRPNAPQPRDARTNRDSVGDFADFIRSTGPANSYETRPPQTAQQTHRGTNGTPRNYSGSIPRMASQPNLPRRASSSAGTKKLQARDAVVPRGDSISDLIDFVRSGPQVEKNGHRISRSVAPFRTTMDSDQMVGAVGGKAIDATLHNSRHSQATNSVQSSVTSQSGLLKHAAMNKLLPNQLREDDFDEDMMPKRKTRRVRDPYAIDFSDEEDDEFEATPNPKPKAAAEESLADFLRNVPPPPSPRITSVFDSVPKPPNKDVRKKSSTPTLSIMSRFGRTSSSSAPAVQKPKTGAIDSRPPGSRSNTHAPALKHAATYDTGRGDTYSPRPDSGRIPRKAYQPRDAVLAPSSRTNDLADFLMESEPPANQYTQPQPFIHTIQKEEHNAFQRMFSRKKVH